MSNLYIIPLESVDGRYTKQWRDNIPSYIEATNKFDNVLVIDGEQLTNFVDVGTFLDIHTTIHYKNNQIQQVSELFRTKQIKDNDSFFFYDMEFWGGVESVRLLAQMNKLNVNIYSFCHAASYTKEDAFAVASYHQQFIEVGWIAACDKVFVGSEYHKQAIIERRLKPIAGSLLQELSNKIIVTGNPMFKDDYKLSWNPTKKKQIILPNRFDFEKRPNISLDLAYILKKEIPDLEIVITTSHPKFKSNKKWLEELARGMEDDGIITIKEGLTKEEYHKVIEESSIMMSNSIEENFGICIFESMVYGTYPLLSNELSHPELVGNCKELLYNDLDEVVTKVKHLLDSSNKLNIQTLMKSRVQHYYNSIHKIIKEI